MPVTIRELIAYLSEEPNLDLPVGVHYEERPEGVEYGAEWFSLAWALDTIEEIR